MLQKLFDKYKKIIIGLFHIPQTLIVDFGKMAQGLAIELGLAADLRLIHNEGHNQLDQLISGQVPCCGGIGLLGSLTNKSFAKNWLFGSKKIYPNELTTSGFVIEFGIK